MKRFIYGVLLLLIVTSISLSPVSAVVEEVPADDFFMSYGISLGKVGSGGILITFSTDAVDIMNILGVSSFDVQQFVDGTWVTVAPDLTGKLRTNVASYTFSLGYSGSSKCTYRIYARFYAQMRNGSQETVCMYSSSITTN